MVGELHQGNAHEPIVMAKKRLEGTNKQNKDKYGTGGINIDEL